MSKKKKQGTRAQRAAQALKPFEFEPGYDLAVVGGGASGLACALACVQEAQRLGMSQPRIIVLEKGRRIGASILRSGNGRCNFSNANLDVEKFWNSDFVAEALRRLVEQCSSDDSLCSLAHSDQLVLDENPCVLPVVEWLERLGLAWEEAQGTGGLLYPRSNKAESVLEVFTTALEEHNVDLRICVQVESIARSGAGFELGLAEVPLPKGGKVGGEEGPRHARIQSSKVVFAAGGAFAPGLLSGVSASALKPWQPVLGPLRAEFPKGVSAAELDGVRAQALVRVPDTGFAEEGEVLFREYGLSGIVVFNASREVEPGGCLLVDLEPRRSEEQLAKFLFARAELFGGATNRQLFRGYLLPQLASAVCAAAGVEPDGPVTASSANALAFAMKNLTFKVQGIADERQCQVHRGGVPVESVSPNALQAKSAPGLYILGEALDVDGPCGGYNLHWGWATGMLAGKSIAANLAKEQQ